MKKYFVLIIIVIIASFAFVLYNLKSQKDNNEIKKELSNVTPKMESKVKTKSYDLPPKMEIDKQKNYQAVIKTTAGDITLELFAKSTPITANNFIFLSKDKFYNGTVFHRVIKGFMIQGGDPKGNGTGGPGYQFPDEVFEGEYKRGIVAMANAGQNTNGSQFFIMNQDYQLPQNYVIFGKVISGIEVVDKIAQSEVKLSASGEMSTPVKPVMINSVEILEN